MTVNQAAFCLGCSVRTVRRAVKGEGGRPVLPAIQLGDTYTIRESDLVEYMVGQRTDFGRLTPDQIERISKRYLSEVAASLRHWEELADNDAIPEQFLK